MQEDHVNICAKFDKDTLIIACRIVPNSKGSRIICSGEIGLQSVGVLPCDPRL